MAFKLAMPFPARTLAAGLAATLLVGCAGEPENPKLGRVDVATVDTLLAKEQSSFTIQREFAGLVLPRQSTDVGFERAGEVVTIAVDEGDVVTAGQLVAALDTELLDTERRELEAQLDELAARVDLNASNLRRALELETKGFAAEQEIDELTAEKATLTANQARVEAALAANAERLDQSALVTPFGGTVSRRFVDGGTVVAAGAPVLRIIESGTLEARVGVPVRIHDRFERGDRVELRAAGRRYEGTILGIGNDVTRATLTVPLRIGFVGDGIAVPGDQAWIAFDDDVPNTGFWVPETALTDGLRGLWNIYTVAPTTDGESATIEQRDVRILYAEEGRTFVTGALADGEQIVASGLQRLVPGQQVRINTPASTGEETALAGVPQS